MKLDLLIRNARIITMDTARPAAAAVGVLNGRIVGLDADVAHLPAAETVDLGGAVLTPGFNDTHCHTTWFGLGLAETDVSGAADMEELYTLLETAAAQPDTTGTGWVMGTGFNQVDHGGRFPDIRVLDRICAGRPLYLRHNSGHMAVANTAALRLAGADAPDFPDPAGGRVVRHPDGTPTGLLQETAQRLVQDLVQPYPLAAIEAALDRGTARYAREGITSFTEAGIGGGWIGHSPLELAAYTAALRDGRLHARAQVMPALDALHQLTGHADDDAGLGLDLGIVTGFGCDRLSLGPAKVFTDGSLISETAAVAEPYCGHDHGTNTGYFQDDPEQMRSRILSAYRSGWSIAAHAIGDRAVDFALDVLTECQRTYGRRAVPNRIEHASITRDEHLPKLAAAGIAVTPQAGFFATLGDAMTASLGPDRARLAYRGRSFVDAGVLLAGSSDRPVADGNVMRCLQAFVDRRSGSGDVFGGPDEGLTPYQALAAYTVNAAEATGRRGSLGSITPGLLADFAVLSDSPLDVPTDEIGDIQVRATILGGEFTHNAL
ncbi:N-substituted formamide deformylase precursor [Arthrobacter saudimassiliensis]|uniref:N-substituted formamide deformylase n=1 Tax=Arthrobacter saudimassiliensis TaxID=1461584 RepID=A0A078MWQ2_9MICC|nr:N-substituted formamide deformylase precursor [Arthrobacter saudimassiliensis]